MTTVKVNAEIGEDGNLRLDVPVGLPAGRAEVVLVVQQGGLNGRGDSAAEAGSSRSGLFVGKCGVVDVDAALGEANEAWKSKLSDLP